MKKTINDYKYIHTIAVSYPEDLEVITSKYSEAQKAAKADIERIYDKRTYQPDVIKTRANEAFQQVLSEHKSKAKSFLDKITSKISDVENEFRAGRYPKTSSPETAVLGAIEASQAVSMLSLVKSPDILIAAIKNAYQENKIDLASSLIDNAKLLNISAPLDSTFGMHTMWEIDKIEQEYMTNTGLNYLVDAKADLKETLRDVKAYNKALDNNEPAYFSYRELIKLDKQKAESLGLGLNKLADAIQNKVAENIQVINKSMDYYNSIPE